MDFPIVIKVKYGETLRRFNASIGVNALLELDMARLTDQIRALFSFPSNADLTLTYTDEDNDEVALVDDNDLYDATRQKLNPLRIQVVKNMVRSARHECTCSSARVVPKPAAPTDPADAGGLNCDLEVPIPDICSNSESFHDPLGRFSASVGPTDSADADGLKCGLEVPNPEICSDSESFHDSLKEDATKTVDNLLDNTEINIDHVKAKSIAVETSSRVGSTSDARKPTPRESEVLNHEISPEARDVATKIRIMEAMSKMGETSDKVKFKSMANENSKPTNNNTLPEAEVEVGYEAGTSNPAIDKGKTKVQLLDDFTNPAIESSFLQCDPSDASFVEVDVGYEQMLLDALERMGFKQIDLNKEVLRKNLFDLNQSITDLCDMGEWDEFLNELEQMGFSDRRMNMELLKKNEGNIKDVVMTLISSDAD